MAPYLHTKRSSPLFLYFAAVFMVWIFLHCSYAVTEFYQQTSSPSVHLVLSTLSFNDYSWTKNLSTQNYKVIPYMVDDQNAQYHTPANQGNEAMGYLTYMYDFYDNLRTSRSSSTAKTTHGTSTAPSNIALPNLSTVSI